MRQSAFTIMTPIDPGEVAELESLLNDIGDHIDDNPHVRFAELEDLHYASFFIVANGTEGAHLFFEGNVDGRTRPFLEKLLETEAARNAVDSIYGHCIGYPPAATDRAAALHYLTSHDIGANAFYVAWPGRTVGEIHREQQLRDGIERFIDEQGRALRQQRPDAIHQRIADRVADDPGTEWARTTPPKPFLVAHGKRVRNLILVLVTMAVLRLVKVAFGRSSTRLGRFAARVILGSIPALAGVAVRQLRTEERKDDRDDRERVPDWQTRFARWTESQDLLGIVRRENVQVQNHMVSVTKVKDGWFRLTTLRLVLWVINLTARLTANKGKLGGISSIHFARWVITPDKSLVFMSNFDGSWESYLNDFIDLAAPGLTAVWTNTENEVGFPRTKWLVTKGARDEARFKAYARFSMVPTNTWYSAYPDLTVSNMENNMRIREALFAPLDPPATAAWLRRL